MRLIGLNGLKRSGKDTTYETMKIIRPDFNIQRVAFADKMKVVAAKMIGMGGNDDVLIRAMNELKEDGTFEIHNNIAKESLMFDGREYLQWLGRAGRETFGESFWIDLVLPFGQYPHGIDGELVSMYEGADILCVTDVRYPNEAERILNLGGEVWEIQRPGLESDGDASEQPLPPEYVTLTIQNGGNLVNLYESIKEIL